MKKPEYRSFTIQIDNTETRAEGETEGLIRGYAITFNALSHNLGDFREIVAPGALTRTLSDGHNVYFLWEHDKKAAPRGSTRSGSLTFTVDDKGLAFVLDPRRLNAAERDALAAGDMQMSFGFYTVTDTWHHPDDGVSIRTLLDIDLVEVSAVMNPAYPDTTAALRSLEASKAESDQSTEVEEVAKTEVEEDVVVRQFSDRDLLDLELDLLAQSVKV